MSAPPSAAAMTAISQRSLIAQAMNSVVVENRPTPAASPSSPSMRLNALLMTMNQHMVRGADSIPSSTDSPLSGFEIPVTR